MKKMRKAIFNINLNYTYDANRKGAKYTLDNEHYMNSGEFAEVALKNAFGYEAVKDANTAFDEGSDIEQLQMSVKSSKATLTSVILGKDLKSSLDTYFARTASNQWAWVILIENTLTVYIMNESEFKEFTLNWAYYQTDRMTVRYKSTSGKMIKWLEEHL